MIKKKRKYNSSKRRVLNTPIGRLVCMPPIHSDPCPRNGNRFITAITVYSHSRTYCIWKPYTMCIPHWPGLSQTIHCTVLLLCVECKGQTIIAPEFHCLRPYGKVFSSVFARIQNVDRDFLPRQAINTREFIQCSPNSTIKQTFQLYFSYFYLPVDRNSSLLNLSQLCLCKFTN